jgi:hypothetical protein
MLRSGEWARGLRTRGTLEQGGDSLEGERVALEREGNSPEGARSPRARRKFVSQHPTLERDGSSLEGCWGWKLDGPLRSLVSWAPPCTGS